jgi:cysteine synthase A
MKGAIEKAREIKEQTENSIILGQFQDPANIDAHYKTTGVELWNDTDGKIDMFVATVGTGGTFSGCAKYLKEKNDQIEVVAVEPNNSPMIKTGVSGPHKIQGIGANFLPENFKREYCDQVVGVDDEEAFESARIFAGKEGILVGISSGAALTAAIKLAKIKGNENKTIVVILPDSGERYMSTELYR